MQVNVSRVLDGLAEQHYEIRELLQGLEECGEEGSMGTDQLYWTALKGLELLSRELRGFEEGLLASAHPMVLRSLSVAEDLSSGELESAGAAAVEEPAVDASDPPPLQTKIIAADQVRREPEKWIPSMGDEYQSLVSKTGAVEELSEGEYRALAEDPHITLEIIPGKRVYVHKT